MAVCIFSLLEAPITITITITILVIGVSSSVSSFSAEALSVRRLELYPEECLPFFVRHAARLDTFVFFFRPQCCRKTPPYQVICVAFFAEPRYLGQLWPPRRWAPLFYCLLQRRAKFCVSGPIMYDDINKTVQGQSRPFEKVRRN